MSSPHSEAPRPPSRRRPCSRSCSPPRRAPSRALGLQMTRTDQPLHVGDERLAYELEVENEASPNPQVGDPLTCSGATGSGNPTPTLTYSWLRDGEAIPGASERHLLPTSRRRGQIDPVPGYGDQRPRRLRPRLRADHRHGGLAAAGGGGAGAGERAAERQHAALALPGPLIASTPSGTATTDRGLESPHRCGHRRRYGDLHQGSPVVEAVTMRRRACSKRAQAVSGPVCAPEATIFKVEEPAPERLQSDARQSRRPARAPERWKRGRSRSASGRRSAAECIPAGAKIVNSTNQGFGADASVHRNGQSARPARKRTWRSPQPRR